MQQALQRIGEFLSRCWLSAARSSLHAWPAGRQRGAARRARRRRSSRSRARRRRAIPFRSPGLPVPVGRDRGGVDPANARIAAHRLADDLLRRIPRAAVDDQDLAQFRPARRERSQGRADASLLVEDGHDRADRPGRGRGRVAAQWCAACAARHAHQDADAEDQSDGAREDQHNDHAPSVPQKRETKPSPQAGRVANSA